MGKMVATDKIDNRLNGVQTAHFVRGTGAPSFWSTPDGMECGSILRLRSLSKERDGNEAGE